ncbi:MAG: indole-3-glycerol phosphate synthase TrpC, partial [Pseudomonadota bacterium]
MSADILARILEVKAEEVAEARRTVDLAAIKDQARAASPVRDFAGALFQRAQASKDAVIAEIKRASPSAGLIRQDFDPAWLARSYEAGGASCLSVLTDRQFFKGDDAFVEQARSACSLPLLRKEFIIDAWQVYQTRAMGADALLLIAAALNVDQLAELSELGESLGLSVLVEVHNEEELEQALSVPGRLLGINNRDLHRFVTDLDTTLRLAPTVPDDRLVVSESGIHTPADIQRLQAGDIGAFLIGESFMRQPDPGRALIA